MSTTAIRTLPQHRIAAAIPNHDDAEVSALGLYDCPESDFDECTRRSCNPLLASVLSAFYDVGDVLHIFQRSHCRSAACELCHDIRMVWAVLSPIECSFEGEYSFFRDAKMAAQRAASEQRRADAQPRRRRWRPRGRENHPVHPLAVMALLDLEKALTALQEGHCGDDDCYICEQARVAAYLLPLLTAQLEMSLIPTVAVLRRRGVNPGRGKILRLLEQAECCS
jgi:hypothetical protein